MGYQLLVVSYRLKEDFLNEVLFNRQLKTDDRQPTTILITNGVNPDETQ